MGEFAWKTLEICHHVCSIVIYFPIQLTSCHSMIIFCRYKAGGAGIHLNVGISAGGYKETGYGHGGYGGGHGKETTFLFPAGLFGRIRSHCRS